MFDGLEFDFRTSKFGSQFVWHGLDAYAGLASSRRFSSEEEAEEDASVIISHLSATAAESSSTDFPTVSDVRPSLSVVPLSDGGQFHLRAA